MFAHQGTYKIVVQNYGLQNEHKQVNTNIKDCLILVLTAYEFDKLFTTFIPEVPSSYQFSVDIPYHNVGFV